MLEFVQQLINGFSLGSIYAVLALGLAMVYSTLGILNFAYGELITIVGYTMYFANQGGAPFLLAAGLGITFAVIASLLMQFALFRPLRGASFVTLLFASFALSQALQGVFRQAISPRARGIAVPELFSTFVTIGDIRIGFFNYRDTHNRLDFHGNSSCFYALLPIRSSDARRRDRSHNHPIDGGARKPRNPGRICYFRNPGWCGWRAVAGKNYSGNANHRLYSNSDRLYSSSSRWIRKHSGRRYRWIHIWHAGSFPPGLLTNRTGAFPVCYGPDRGVGTSLSQTRRTYGKAN